MQLNNLPTFKILLILLLVVISKQTIEISPMSYLQTVYSALYERPEHANFNIVNINTNQTTMLTEGEVKNPSDYSYKFYGSVVYFKTGIRYYNYFMRIGPGNDDFGSALLAIDTSTGKLLFDNFQYCEGINSFGLAIDQTNGDLHFLNHSTANNFVDWTKWNCEMNVTTVLQRNASDTPRMTGSMGYDPLTSTLWSLDEYSRLITKYTQNEKTSQFKVSEDISYLTINPQSGQLYATNFQYPGMYYIVALNLNSDGSQLVISNVCEMTTELALYVYYQDSADFDYVSNTFAITLRSPEYSPPYDFTNVIFTATISGNTCTRHVFVESTPHFLLWFGAARFTSPAMPN